MIRHSLLAHVNLLFLGDFGKKLVINFLDPASFHMHHHPQPTL